MSTQVQLKERPKDIISSVRFGPLAPVLLVSSWDGVLRVYDARPDSGVLYGSVQYSAPLLATAWDTSYGSSTAYTGGIEQRVYAVDVERTRSMPIGRDHDGAVQALAVHTESGTVISGSWDRTIQQIDPRSGPEEHRKPTIQVQEKVIGMDAAINGHRLVVATGGRRMLVFDMRRMDMPVEKRESSLKYPVKSIRSMPWAGEPGFVSASIEGRVAVDFYDEARQDQRYAFKCHRISGKQGGEKTDVDTVFPVNGLGFDPNNPVFFTGGSDGCVAMWDYQAKKRLKTYSGFGGPVVSLDVDGSTGTMLAVGVSDDGYRVGHDVDLDGSSVWVVYK